MHIIVVVFYLFVSLPLSLSLDWSVYVPPMLVECWARVVGDVPTFFLYWVNVLCLLDCQ